MDSHLLIAIGQDPVLRHVKLIAEPWDASMDGYRVGEFPPPWVEWNDQYRDEIRDFWRNHSAGIRTVATRLAGSSDLYLDDGRSPYASINFVTAHDGFTLRDLVTYEHKRNEANGEDNRDGTDNNRSWNHGVEGETDDPALLAVRRRQAANMMATLCLSNGVPMITAGDERGRTQRGNNNAYAQDNEISWIDWRPDDAWLDVYEITKTALRLRREHPALRQRHWFEGRPTIRGGPKDLAWLHPSGREMTGDDWHDPQPAARSGCSSPAPRCAPPARAASSRSTSRSCSGSTPTGCRSGSRSPRTTGCRPARSCSPPTPSCPSAPTSRPATGSPSAAAPSSSSARPDGIDGGRDAGAPGRRRLDRLTHLATVVTRGGGSGRLPDPTSRPACACPSERRARSSSGLVVALEHGGADHLALVEDDDLADGVRSALTTTFAFAGLPALATYDAVGVEPTLPSCPPAAANSPT